MVFTFIIANTRHQTLPELLCLQMAASNDLIYLSFTSMYLSVRDLYVQFLKSWAYWTVWGSEITRSIITLDLDFTSRSPTFILYDIFDYRLYTIVWLLTKWDSEHIGVVRSADYLLTAGMLKVWSSTYTGNICIMFLAKAISDLHELEVLPFMVFHKEIHGRGHVSQLHFYWQVF